MKAINYFYIGRLSSVILDKICPQQVYDSLDAHFPQVSQLIKESTEGLFHSPSLFPSLSSISLSSSFSFPSLLPLSFSPLFLSALPLPFPSPLFLPSSPLPFPSLLPEIC